MIWVKRQERYNGLVERCAPGVHRSISNLVRSMNVPPDRPILDIAAGSGALLSRLKDIGFKNLHGIEIDQENFKLTDVNLISLDLNQNFSDQFKTKFGLITAIEIIEHLDNPRHFLSQVRELLSPDGILIVSTPNAEHWLGRIKFLLKGELKHFGRVDYCTQRHISPIMSYQMLLIFEELGFNLVGSGSAGSFWGYLKSVIYKPVGFFMRLVMRGALEQGEVNYYVAKMSQISHSSPGLSSSYSCNPNFRLSDDEI